MAVNNKKRDYTQIADASERAEAVKALYKKAQESLVACLLASSEMDVSDVFRLVDPDCFDEPRFKAIFTVSSEIARRSEKIDPYSVAKALEEKGELVSVGGFSGLAALATQGEALGLESTIKIRAEILKEYSNKNSIRAILEESTSKFIGDAGKNSYDFLNDLQSDLNEMMYKMSNDTNVVSISQEAEGYFELLEERNKSSLDNGLLGIPSLLPSLNKYTNGWRPSQLITVAARTGVGKTVFAINSAVAAMQSNKSVLFMSLEMTHEEINDRIVSSISSIPIANLKKGDLNERQRATLEEVLGELKLSKLKIDTTPDQTVESIKAKALKLAQSPEGLDFLVIDYLNLINTTGNPRSRQEAVAEITRNLKLISRQLEIPVMVLTQVNRQKSENEDGAPELDNIRESGATAQDSDVVIILHRNKATDEEVPPTYVILAKQREGAADKTIKCNSFLECSVFREIVNKKSYNFTDDEIDELDSKLDEDIDDVSIIDDDDDEEEGDWDEFE